MLRWLLIALAGVAGLSPLLSTQSKVEITYSHSPDDIRSSWGKRLNRTGVIPARGFRAFYFDRNAPRNVVFEEDVEDVAIKYAWADFHKIDSKSFGAYWVGKLTFPEATTKQFSVSQSWAKSRILIDGETVFDESNRSRTFTHSFTPGEHVVEVEYVNNWHTVEFKVTIEDVVETLSEDELAGRLMAQEGKFAGVYYAGLYESARKDANVDLTMPNMEGPALLWLTSYEAIDWNIGGLPAGSTVILSSYSPGSRVRGLADAQVLHLGKAPGLYRKVRQCSCTAGHYHCEGDQDLNDLAEKVLELTGLTLDGYAVDYSAPALTIQPYAATDKVQISKQREAQGEAQKLCVRKANPDFDTLME